MLPLLGQVAHVDHGGWPEGPAESLDPRHDGKEANPTHQVDRLGFRVIARNRDAARKSQNEYSYPETGGDEDGENYKGCVVPEANLKSQQ